MKTLKVKALATIAAACMALIATGTASADDKNRDPWDRPMCSLKVYNGTLWYREGETVTINHADGTKETLRCSNGSWVKVRVAPPVSTSTTAPGGGVLTLARPR